MITQVPPYGTMSNEELLREKKLLERSNLLANARENEVFLVILRAELHRRNIK